METNNFDQKQFFRVYQEYLKENLPTLRNKLLYFLAGYSGNIRELPLGGNPQPKKVHIFFELLKNHVIETETSRTELWQGDIIITDLGYDRDIIVNRCPMVEVMGGFLVNDKHKKILLPLYDPDVIKQKIRTRLEAGITNSLNKFSEYL